MRFVFLAVLLMPAVTFGQEDPRTYRPYSYEEAFNITTGALLKNPNISILVKNSEHWGWKPVRAIGLNEDYVRTGATVIAPIVYGKFSTRGMHFHWEPKKNFLIRPDVEYYFWKPEFNSQLNLTWRF